MSRPSGLWSTLVHSSPTFPRPSACEVRTGTRAVSAAVDFEGLVFHIEGDESEFHIPFWPGMESWDSSPRGNGMGVLERI